MTLDEIRKLADADMAAVNSLIQRRLHSDVPLVDQLGNYIIAGGGKRLRPLIVLLCARACGYAGEQHIQLAAVVEFIHTATLLHDDVVDESSLRRGRDTANALFGNAASVLVGDFLYTRAFQMMVEAGRMRVMEIMAETTNIIAEGEVMQLMNCHDPDTDEARYMDVIRCKTAKLFEASARLGAVLCDLPTSVENALAEYGARLGTAFQLMDDVLDYSADEAALGKHIGDDLAEGKPTLPLIHVMRHGNAAQRACVREAIEQGGRERIGEILQAIASTGALDYTRRLAVEEASRATQILDALPDSAYRKALAALAGFSANRNH
ncbi:MAG: octaprenyl diphosphate synthase [Halothiobacillaceae bacterium]|jgi:octaprenyl-diphosphate synthase|nr:octaprenyl diphosphate synthase [Halothiobacillaceae bacterium]